MKFTGATLLAAAAGLATATTVKYDPTYDTAGNSLTSVACSDGANGLITKYQWQTFGQVAGFPYIGSSSDIAGWNSASCGQCYEVAYNGNTIHMLAIDHAGDGLVMSTTAMNALTGGNAVQFGTVDATVTKVASSACGLNAKRAVEFGA
ncbi:Hypothetical predicted protein [Lecanosticta acicola]|uniref:Cerato-platanin n=1 Tax=Lecanosticta acicola TaxID=111012 RepID=A0AAI8YPG4_9PEZI|nr:Hypothetical predicted protein [Lecanosticta acicola]